MNSTSTIGEVRPEHDRASGSDLVLLHFTRAFALPILELWSYLTDPSRLSPWFGTMVGDPFGGKVEVTTNDDCCNETIHVTVATCTSPHELDVSIDGAVLEMKLHQVGVVTTLELVRRHLHPNDVAASGMRWQFYLDRLEATIAQVPLPRWADYAALAVEYRSPE